MCYLSYNVADFRIEEVEQCPDDLVRFPQSIGQTTFNISRAHIEVNCPQGPFPHLYFTNNLTILYNISNCILFKSIHTIARCFYIPDLSKVEFTLIRLTSPLSMNRTTQSIFSFANIQQMYLNLLVSWQLTDRRQNLQGYTTGNDKVFNN